MKCLEIFNQFFMRIIAVSAFGVWCHATAYAEDMSAGGTEKELRPDNQELIESLNTEDFEGALASLRTAFINAGGGSDTFSDYMLDEELLWNVSAEFHDGSGVPQSKAVSLIFEIVAVGEKDAT